MKVLLVPWLASSFAFELMFVAFMVVTVWLETSAPPPPIVVVRGALGFFALGLVIQFAYGGLVYVILTERAYGTSGRYLSPISSRWLCAAGTPVTLRKTFWESFGGWSSR